MIKQGESLFIPFRNGEGVPDAHCKARTYKSVDACRKALKRDFDKAEIVEYAPVKHGEWELEVNAFYKDNPFEEINLCIYILAKCGNCGRMHPNSYQVYSKDLYAEGGNNHPFDVEYEKRVALKEFRERGHLFANYCPNCGAMMKENGKDV